tara:strand:+ start:566 stop:1852 length:1287 start_codon:yes stop_codon:yes gene_type:complete
MSTTPAKNVKLFDTGLQERVICPHCWHEFSPDETYWISEHPEVESDPLLGSVDEKLRFLPSRFDINGNALDERGEPCRELACPHCHLLVPRASYEMEPHFCSIVGTPSSGKSYFLGSLIWQLRQQLPKRFELSFDDADPKLNKIIAEYERLQFFNPKKDQYVKITKTEESGSMYSTVKYSEENIVTYPKPFFFTVRPTSRHPSVGMEKQFSKLITLYDNAGESFDPGKVNVSNRVTLHLSKAKTIFFLYDPTQDPAFREACKTVSTDPQVANADAVRNDRQDIIFNNMTTIIRQNAGLTQTEKHDCPIVVIVTKFDIWKPLVTKKSLPSLYVPDSDGGPDRIRVDAIETISDKIRKLLQNYAPSIVSSAEAFSDDVIYIPVSATGVSPSFNVEKKELGIRPMDINPLWSELPLTYALAKWSRGLIRTT